MRPYVAALSARFRVLLQYRAAALAGITTQVFFGFVRIAAFEALYASSPGSHPLTLEQTRAYIWLSQAFLLVAMMGVDAEIAALIRGGNVAAELTRPVDLHSWWFARIFSGRAAPTCLRAIPIIVVAALIAHLPAPASPASGALFVVMMLLSVVLASAMFTLVTISLLWTISGEGAARLAPAIVYFLSGLVVPLPLLPDWCQPVFDFLPFRSLLDAPLRTYLGDIAVEQALVGVATQVLWIGAFVILGRALLARGLRRLVIQGG